MQLHNRPAQASDIDAAVPLIYSSGIQAFEYGFSHSNYQALDFLRFAFSDGRGFFGWRNHSVVTLDKSVVGIGAFYSGGDYLRLSIGLVWQVFRFYPLILVPFVLWHILQLKALMPPPTRAMHYVANFAVDEQLRGQGIGTFLLRYQQDVAKQLGRSIYALDVSVENPRAQALYQQLGFRVIRLQRFSGKVSVVADTKRMEMSLG
jgi:ribosomal protein S18 acetylase RimI-like enzyme